MARTTKKAAVTEEEPKTPQTPLAEETAVTASPSPEVEIQAEPVEETAVAAPPSPEAEIQAEPEKETAVAKVPAAPPPEPKKAAKKAPAIAPSEMVWAKLVGAKTATVNHQAVLLDEVIHIRYSYYAQLRNELPGFFAVKLPGSTNFVVE